MNRTSNINITNGSIHKDYENDCLLDHGKASNSYSQMLVMCFIMTFGVVGNIFIIVLAAKFTVRKSLHHLIINMAVSDVLLICNEALNLLVEFINVSLDETSFTVVEFFVCKLMPFVRVVTRAVSLISLLIITIERFKATKGLTIPRTRSPLTIRRHRIAAICASWIVPMLLTAYELTYGIMLSFGECDLSHHSPALAWILFHYFFMLVTFVLTFFLSAAILLKLFRSNGIADSLTRAQRKLRRQRISGAAQMVMWSLLLYSCCYLPLSILQAIQLFSQITGLEIFKGVCFDLDNLDYYASDLLPCLNSCLSPCFYIIFLSDFRLAAKRVLFFNCCSDCECRRISPDFSQDRVNTTSQSHQPHLLITTSL